MKSDTLPTLKTIVVIGIKKKKNQLRLMLIMQVLNTGLSWYTWYICIKELASAINSGNSVPQFLVCTCQHFLSYIWSSWGIRNVESGWCLLILMQTCTFYLDSLHLGGLGDSMAISAMFTKTFMFQFQQFQVRRLNPGKSINGLSKLGDCLLFLLLN